MYGTDAPSSITVDGDSTVNVWRRRWNSWECEQINDLYPILEVLRCSSAFHSRSPTHSSVHFWLLPSPPSRPTTSPVPYFTSSTTSLLISSCPTSSSYAPSSCAGLLRGQIYSDRSSLPLIDLRRTRATGLLPPGLELLDKAMNTGLVCAARRRPRHVGFHAYAEYEELSTHCYLPFLVLCSPTPAIPISRLRLQPVCTRIPSIAYSLLIIRVNRRLGPVHFFDD
ncbi:hypothetical protein NUW54_g10725 [Trametes sanguinea]|uniref:Uncharacterized protein n=1 Tax=Trametes sanguinea TaxID=158606 RepID=A0ACC1NUQ1_9APHY|nr:hypothetical protein NUW54_g10725 [Trametes sanguinea]